MALSAAPAPARRARGLLARLRQHSTTEPAPRGDSLVGDAGDPSGGQEPDRLAPELGELGEDEREEGPLERGIAAFNHSEYPRRIAGLARSLGSPEVSVALDEDLSLVWILVAWELCWYRYEVDITVRSPEVRSAAQGTELSELARGERLTNALAGEHGAISLAAVRA